MSKTYPKDGIPVNLYKTPQTKNIISNLVSEQKRNAYYKKLNNDLLALSEEYGWTESDFKKMDCDLLDRSKIFDPEYQKEHHDLLALSHTGKPATSPASSQTRMKSRSLKQAAKESGK